MSSRHLVEYAPLVESGGLETSVLGVEFQIAPLDDTTARLNADVVRLTPGGVQLNCTAAVGSVYWKSTSWTLRREQDRLTETLPAAATSLAAAASPASSVAFLLLLPLLLLVDVNKNQ